MKKMVSVFIILFFCTGILFAEKREIPPLDSSLSKKMVIGGIFTNCLLIELPLINSLGSSLTMYKISEKDPYRGKLSGIVIGETLVYTVCLASIITLLSENDHYNDKDKLDLSALSYVIPIILAQPFLSTWGGMAGYNMTRSEQPVSLNNNSLYDSQKDFRIGSLDFDINHKNIKQSKLKFNLISATF